MAYLIMSDGRKTQLDREKALSIWRVLNGQDEATEEQEEFISSIKEVFLNWNHAPDDYLIKYRKLIEPVLKAEWRCNEYGTPTRPQAGDITNERVSRLYGLVW